MEISPVELKKRLDNGDNVVLVDVRGAHELYIANLDNSLHIPMDELQHHLAELKELEAASKDIVLYCRTGQRSLNCAHALKNAGFKRIYNLTGGLHAWSDQVDPSVMKY
ncbi:MAG: sulfurtransferase [Cyanobacteria bacterium]|nr:sulfurtransferase [Cyanobacteriota bacterium]